MKGLIPVITVLVLISSGMAWCQQGSIYDNSYRGPVNYYGQPQFQPLPQNYGRTPPGQSPPIDDGLIFQGAHQVGRLGNYLWSYMPAPLRGVTPPIHSYQNRDSSVHINFVPGSN